ncbi:MAG: hypothetical protein ACYDAG_02750 [Chloroflexota bacterium]
MMYELVDLEGANLLGTYRTEDEALAAVREEIDQNGIESLRTLGLGTSGRHGRAIARGTQLANLALARAKQSA